MKAADYTWREVWREGVAPLLSRQALTALRNGLAANDPRLIQGLTTLPRAANDLNDLDDVVAACVLGYCGWQGEGLETVHAVEEFFALLCFRVDYRLGIAAICHRFTNAFDELPRELIFRELLAEVDAELARRPASEESVHVHA